MKKSNYPIAVDIIHLEIPKILPEILQKILNIQQCGRLQNGLPQINSFYIHHQQTYKESNHGHSSIHNSLKQNSISRNNLKQGGERPQNEMLNL